LHSPHIAWPPAKPSRVWHLGEQLGSCRLRSRINHISRPEASLARWLPGLDALTTDPAWPGGRRADHRQSDFHDEDEDLNRYDDGDEGDLEELGTPVYRGSGLSVRALTAEELQRFLDAHQEQSAELLGSGWAALDPPVHPRVGPRTPPEAELESPGPPAVVPARAVAGSLGSPGRSALVAARRRRAEELIAWMRSLAWRAPLVAAAGLLGQVLAIQAGLPYGALVGLAIALLVGWRLRFRPSEQVTARRRGGEGERRTARLLERLTRDGYVVFHDLAVPDSPANVDHLVIGPSGVFVIDSKQWSGSIHQGADGLVWHNHYPLDRALETVRWEARAISHVLGTRAAALWCVHGAHVQGGGLEVQGVAIVPADLLRGALGYDRVLSEAEVGLLAATARARLRPAA
jgi:Nuclease-related domain